MAHNDLFSVQIGSKKNFKMFYQLFFRTSGLQHKLLNLIIAVSAKHISLKISQKKWSGCGLQGKIWAKVSPVLWKKQRNWYFSGVFFHILHEVYIYKQKGIVVI